MTLESAVEHYGFVKDHAERSGRRAEDVGILPGVALVLGSTEAEAVERYDRWEELGSRDYALRRLSGIIVGTPERVADTLEAWFRAGAADGFNLEPTLRGRLAITTSGRRA